MAIEYVIYKVDENLERIDGCKNTEGAFIQGSDSDNLWLTIVENGCKFRKGDLLCICNSDFKETYEYYIIVESNNGVYRVERIQGK